MTPVQYIGGRRRKSHRQDWQDEDLRVLIVDRRSRMQARPAVGDEFDDAQPLTRLQPGVMDQQPDSALSLVLLALEWGLESGANPGVLTLGWKGLVGDRL